MTTKQAFAQLISKRGWYNELGIGKSMADSLVKRFKDGEKISTDKIEEILILAGARVEIEKRWTFEPEYEGLTLVNRPDSFFEDYYNWKALHEHMFTDDTKPVEWIKFYDIYMQRLAEQEARTIKNKN